ncbi:hypothetical protein [Enterococcus cecorum]|uniref:hypothetical protein n=1 Tax=Enterococcus cecorum TaxID=44008 RepID=UPI0013A61072|nr:hypothetical protein [Enterococcus cecorum]
MTKQIQDTIIFNGKSCNILALSSDLDFFTYKRIWLRFDDVGDRQLPGVLV